MIKRIAITGPESTGKSQLAVDLAQHYKTVFTPEYAREYLELHGSHYVLKDLENIAIGQLADEKEKAKLSNTYLFCDTELIVIKIWAEHAFQHCPNWVLHQIEAHPYDLYLLCNIDLPWEPDPLREHPHNREYFFNLYRKELINRKLPFEIINGIGNERTKKAINLIDQRFTPRN